MLIGITCTLIIMGIVDSQYPKPQEKAPKPEAQKFYQAPSTRYTTKEGYWIYRIIIETDTLYCSKDFSAISHD